MSCKMTGGASYVAGAISLHPPAAAALFWQGLVNASEYTQDVGGGQVRDTFGPTGHVVDPQGVAAAIGAGKHRGAAFEGVEKVFTPVNATAVFKNKITLFNEVKGLGHGLVIIKEAFALLTGGHAGVGGELIVIFYPTEGGLQTWVVFAEIEVDIAGDHGVGHGAIAIELGGGVALGLFLFRDLTAFGAEAAAGHGAIGRIHTAAVFIRPRQVVVAGKVLRAGDKLQGFLQARVVGTDARFHQGFDGHGGVGKVFAALALLSVANAAVGWRVLIEILQAKEVVLSSLLFLVADFTSLH